MWHILAYLLSSVTLEWNEAANSLTCSCSDLNDEECVTSADEPLSRKSVIVCVDVHIFTALHIMQGSSSHEQNVRLLNA